MDELKSALVGRPPAAQGALVGACVVATVIGTMQSHLVIWMRCGFIPGHVSWGEGLELLAEIRQDSREYISGCWELLKALGRA